MMDHRMFCIDNYSFSKEYDKWLENYVYEYERVPSEDEVYDFYLKWVEDYAEHAAECAAIDKYEEMKELGR